MSTSVNVSDTSKQPVAETSIVVNQMVKIPARLGEHWKFQNSQYRVEVFKHAPRWGSNGFALSVKLKATGNNLDYLTKLLKVKDRTLLKTWFLTFHHTCLYHATESNVLYIESMDLDLFNTDETRFHELDVRFVDTCNYHIFTRIRIHKTA